MICVIDNDESENAEECNMPLTALFFFSKEREGQMIEQSACDDLEAKNASQIPIRLISDVIVGSLCIVRIAATERARADQ